MLSRESVAPDPTVAVVICTRDRPDALLRTIESVWTQTRLPDELIVIDDGALPPDVPERIAARCHELGIIWRCARSRRPGLTRARNQAAELASSDILQYLDDDVTCEPGFLAEIAAIMRDPLVGGVTANVREPSFESRSARWYQLGYRLAGWWSVGPRRRPHGPPPAVVGRSDVAVPTKLLFGAAMALRRDAVCAYRFDESLAEYALGEDHEIGYRLAAHHWLVQARRARAVHHRAPTQRTAARRLGFMTSHNYIAILRKTCSLGPGDWLLIGWSLAVLAGMHLVWAVVGSRRQHLDELRGMIDGLLASLTSVCRVSQSDGERHRRFEPPSQSLASSRRLDRRRVLFVTNRLEPGGAERMLLALVKRLRPHGVEPLIGCLKDAGPLAGECHTAGIPVFDRLLHFKTDAAVLLRLGRILREHRVDAIVVAHSGGDRMFWSTLAGGLCGVPVVVWSHWFPVPAVRHFEIANHLLFRWVASYVALGERHRQALIRLEGVPAGRIVVIPNAIETDRFVNAAPRAEVRRRLGLADRHVAVAIIANLRPGKRHDVFIEAARLLAAENAELRFLIIGDGPHRAAVHAAAAASKLPPDVLRLLGTRDDIADLLPGIDISCLCSENEYFQECLSVVMLEAAAAGCAFIGPDSGCLADFLGHRRTGLLIRPADVAGLTDAIRELAADASLRRRLADAARQKVMAGYSLDAMARSFAALLRG